MGVFLEKRTDRFTIDRLKGPNEYSLTIFHAKIEFDLFGLKAERY